MQRQSKCVIMTADFFQVRKIMLHLSTNTYLKLVCVQRPVGDYKYDQKIPYVRDYSVHYLV